MPSLTRPRVCLISAELAPFGGGGIGVYIAALAGVLAEDCDVLVLTTEAHRGQYERLIKMGRRPLPAGVRIVFAAPPTHRQAHTFFGWHHAWSACLLTALREAYRGGPGPDLIEVPDYHGEGFSIVQAARTGDPTLATARLVVRAHTTWEMCTVLDGRKPTSLDEKVICSMERYVLRESDHLLWAGGDILGTYDRFYEGRLAAPVQARHPLPAGAAAAPPELDDERAVRLVYVGRLERRKGVLEALEALMRIYGQTWTLDLVGGDTPTAPGGASMEATLVRMAAGDPRVRVRGALPADETAAVMDASDVLLMPSRWECWPYAVLEALRANRPVVATAVGGHTELIRDGQTGRLCAPGPDALAASVRELLRDRESLRRWQRSGACREHAIALTDPAAIREAYASVLDRPPRRAHRAPHRTGGGPLVSIVLPYRGMRAYIEEALASARAQTYDRLELLVVHDGGARREDADLAAVAGRYGARVVWRSNGGLGEARNTGLAVSHGRYLLPLDPDNTLEPTFVERALAVLEAEHDLAYVTAWSRFVDDRGDDLDPEEPHGYQPLGNWTELVHERNVAGDAIALWRRSLFDLGLRYSVRVPAIEDWTLYRQMAQQGLYGAVIPERLINYRVRPDSMYQEVDAIVERLRDEATAELEVEAFRWTPQSA